MAEILGRNSPFERGLQPPSYYKNIPGAVKSYSQRGQLLKKKKPTKPNQPYKYKRNTVNIVKKKPYANTNTINLPSEVNSSRYFNVATAH